jgi:aspartokinase/homoserine dehydrogenase 1
MKSVSDFQNTPPNVDEQVQKRVDEARRRGCVLRHIASVDVKRKKIDIKIIEVPDRHMFAVSAPGCACVRFFTLRHTSYPLVIQGPSAGTDSTASALLADLLQRMRGKSYPRRLALNREGSSTSLLQTSKTS